MALKTMYPGIAYSPPTALKADITAAATTISVYDLSVFPDAPNVAVIGGNNAAETIRYTGKNTTTGSLTGVTRGFEGETPSAFPAGTEIGRNFTNYDYQTLIDNMNTVAVVANGGQYTPILCQQ